MTKKDERPNVLDIAAERTFKKLCAIFPKHEPKIEINYIGGFKAHTPKIWANHIKNEYMKGK